MPNPADYSVNRLIYNCDGCLYPNANALLEQIREVKIKLYKSLNISDEEFEVLSQTARERGKGLVNLLHVMSEFTKVSLKELEQRLSDEIDYVKIIEKPNPHLSLLFEQWQNEGGVVCVLTNNSQYHVQEVFKHLGIQRNVAAQIRVMTPKLCPKRNAFIVKPEAQSFVQLSPGSDLFFDDTLENIAAAQQAGLNAHLLNKADSVEIQTRAALKKYKKDV